MLDRAQETLKLLGEKNQSKINEFVNVRPSIEIKHDIPATIPGNRKHTDLSQQIQKFFLTHLIFTEEQLRQHCIEKCGTFSETEYNQALKIACNVFREDPNV